MHLRVHYGQGDAWEASTCTQVHDAGSIAKVYNLSYTQRVEYMMLVEVVNVLSRDDIYLAVPVVIELVHHAVLLHLLGGEGWKITLD